MPTDREKGERHEFISGALYPESCIYRHDGERTTPKCGQPPDAEVHRVAELKFPEPCPSCGAARWVEDVCACPLPATEKPAEARPMIHSVLCYTNPCDLCLAAPPLAQPEETPKRIGERTLEEWRDVEQLPTLWAGIGIKRDTPSRDDYFALIAAAFSRQGER